MASDNSGLLIAALVAIVAVVGLVILFKGDSTGATVSSESFLCPPGQKATMYPDTTGLICTPMQVAAQRHVAFDRPLGSSGDDKYFDYPGTDW